MTFGDNRYDSFVDLQHMMTPQMEDHNYFWTQLDKIFQSIALPIHIFVIGVVMMLIQTTIDMTFHVISLSFFCE